MNATAFLTPLAQATDPDGYGGKASQLAAALRSGLPVPDGYAVRWSAVRTTASGDPTAAIEYAATDHHLGPWAVRSSAVGEDSELASFAGAHLSLLGVVGRSAVVDAVCQVHESAGNTSASSYRDHRGIEGSVRMGVVLQQMVPAEVAGVMFTRHPVTGAAERVIEASWGLGETVVSGMVTPDQYRVDPDGVVLERCPGEKDLAIVLGPDGRTYEHEVTGARVEQLCLSDRHLQALHRLAGECDRVFGGIEHDIEFAFTGEVLYLLQRRPITHG